MKTYLILIAGMVMAGLSSCSKILDQAPVSAGTDQNFWKTGTEANSAVASCYALLRRALMEVDGVTFFAYGDLPTPQFASGLGGEDWGQVGNIQWNLSVPFASTHRPMMKLRQPNLFYRVIDQSNRCIRFIPTIEESKFSNAAVKRAYLGEAYFMRAFAYFYMARVWGDVPLVLESVNLTDNTVSPPRTDKAKVLEQCVKDLETAIPLLQYNYYVSSNDKAVRANRGTAFALLAHIRAWQGDYDKTAAAADSVIAKGGYSYVPRDSTNYRSIYRGQSNEGIFEISMNAANEKVSFGSIAFRTLRAPYFRLATATTFPLNPDYLKEIYADSTDLRRQNVFAYWNSSDPICIKYATITYPSATADPIASHNLIVFRYTDIKLLKAEALAATGKYTEAKVVLDEVRKLAGLKPTTATNAELFSKVIEERQRELFLEGHCFYDLVRLGRKTGEIKFGGSPIRMSAAEFSQGKYYWPIDPLTISLNRSLTQTPFWSSRM